MSAPLVDGFARVHDSLRISVTDRCNIRCFYCMPDEGVQFMDRSEILTFEEIERFVRVAASLGVNKLRITGGEPLVRRDLPRLIERLASVPGIHDLALTTNAVLLEQYAQRLYDAGLQRPEHPYGCARSRTFPGGLRRDDLFPASWQESKRRGVSVSPKSSSISLLSRISSSRISCPSRDSAGSSATNRATSSSCRSTPKDLWDRVEDPDGG